MFLIAAVKPQRLVRIQLTIERYEYDISLVTMAMKKTYSDLKCNYHISKYIWWRQIWKTDTGNMTLHHKSVKIFRNFYELKHFFSNQYFTWMVVPAIYITNLTVDHSNVQIGGRLPVGILLLAKLHQLYRSRKKRIIVRFTYRSYGSPLNCYCVVLGSPLCLTHWGRVTHKCISNLAIIGILLIGNKLQ